VIDRRQLVLIARREVVERLRQRSFLIGTAVTLLVLALVIVLPRVLGGGSSTTYRVGVTSAVPAPYVQALRGASIGEVRLDVRVLGDRTAAEASVAAGHERLALVDPQTIVVGSDRSATAEAIVATTVRTVTTTLALERAGLSASAIRAALSAPPAAVRTAAGARDAKARDDRKTIAAVASFFLYFQLVSLGFLVASGVVEEKASRVIEILLAATRPRTLLSGKLLGIGVIGILQILVQAILGLALVKIFGGITFSSDVIWIVGVSAGFFLLGYAFYSILFAAAASLVPRQEELQNVTGPMTILIVGSFVLTFPTLSDPSSTLLTVLSFVPPISVLTMPIRLAAGTAGPLSGILAALLLVAAIAAVLPIASRVYGRSVLATGARIPLRRAIFGGR
jgi:ABC-2 type transport system permease protein